MSVIKCKVRELQIKSNKLIKYVKLNQMKSFKAYRSKIEIKIKNENKWIKMKKNRMKWKRHRYIYFLIHATFECPH